MTAFILSCYDQIMKFDGPRKVLVICECSECTPIEKYDRRLEKTKEIQEVAAIHEMGIPGWVQTKMDRAERRLDK